MTEELLRLELEATIKRYSKVLSDKEITGALIRVCAAFYEQSTGKVVHINPTRPQ